MDPRQELANKLIDLLASITRVRTAEGAKVAPLPGFMFDQLVAMIRSLLCWLNYVEEIDEAAYNERLTIHPSRAAGDSQAPAVGRNVA